MVNFRDITAEMAPKIEKQIRDEEFWARVKKEMPESYYLMRALEMVNKSFSPTEKYPPPLP